MKKRNRLHLFTLALLLGLSSCLPGAELSRTRSASSATVEEEEESTQDPQFENEDSISWYSNGQSYSNTITINENIDTVIYLRGKPIHEFLETTITNADNTQTSYQNLTYCLIASYNSTGAQKNLRVRAVPISFNNFSTNTLERLFRVDLPEEGASTSECSGSAYHILTTASSANSVANDESSFIASKLCPSCNKTVSSTDVSLYFSGSPLTVNEHISQSLLNLGNMTLRVSSSAANSDSGSSSGSCTDSSCTAKGYDCCLDGQCVRDGALRANAEDDEDFAQALIDVANNPSHFINWPAIYYVCGSTPPTTDPTPTEGPDAEATANGRLQELITDWKCLQEGEKEEPNYISANVCAPDHDEDSYESIRSKVWAYCGCAATPFPTDPDQSSCPNYTLKAYNEDNEEILSSDENFKESEIQSISCYAPIPEPEPTPFQNLSLSVSSRSVPHRFFKASDGEAVDNLEDIQGTSLLPEGTPFAYLDDSAKTNPYCSNDPSSSAECTFNMNSVLGQMSLDLSHARPAAVVNLDYDQSYIISTVSGTYTPCPQCDNDYWFQSFTAFPSSQMGVGLEGVNYTTNRSAYNSNTGLGNYGDTIFGRACFVPPTMIPLSHRAIGSVAQQRSNRLLTQAALYVNGYQRDWYGFNRGALIGSFDGVKWFAIGKNRRVTATSSKLFLAINAPFADLAERTDLTVQIILDEGNSTAPSYDYDPNEEPNHINEGTGASCQRWHQCQTDTDCITALGWEYMCLDTGFFKSKWPKFNIKAEETENDEYNGATFHRILQDGFPSGTKKRCVYRGSGALCKGDFTSGLTNARQKMFACAPNFHCEPLDNNRFNDKIIRTPAQTGSLLYGFDSDVLGRPEKYLEGDATLPEEVITTLRHNASNYTTEINDIGLCRPGRDISQSNFINQHSRRDNFGRTDYISQVGTCNSSTTGSDRLLGCPVIQREEDQDVAVGDLLFQVGTEEQSIQNSCGGESQAALSSVTSSLFSSIEAEPLASLAGITTESLAADACLRRAGSVCHSDLDCTPNRLHNSVSFNYGQIPFGNTEAEMRFWQEPLICGQGAQRPSNTDSDYYDYSMSLNRCCREVGKDFTMYTENDPQTEDFNSSLRVTLFPSDDPDGTGRYSRYIISGSEDIELATARGTPYAQAPIIEQSPSQIPPTHNEGIPKAFQWKTFNDTGSLTCCGGGWIRKFADGSTNWNNPSRLEIDPTQFQCLNYIMEIPKRSNSPLIEELNINATNFEKERGNYCLSPVEGGCSQVAFTDPTYNGLITPPIPKSMFTGTYDDGHGNTITTGFNTATFNTAPFYPPAAQGAKGMANLSINVPYEPVLYTNTQDIDLDNDDDYEYFFNITDYPAVSFYLPSYIGGRDNITEVRFRYYDEDGNVVGAHHTSTHQSCAIPSLPPTRSNPRTFLNDGRYCIHETTSPAPRIFHASLPGTIPADADYAAVEIDFNIPNGHDFIYNTGQDFSREGMIPGNDMYYLTKLARLELLGIPQIVYEPLFCNDNRSKVVQGIFNGVETRSDVLSEGFFNHMNTGNYAQNQRTLLGMYDDRYENSRGITGRTSQYDSDEDGSFDEYDYSYWFDSNDNGVINPGVDDISEKFSYYSEENFELPAVFSSHEFRCCIQLGQEASEAANCCSGHMDSDNICKLPSGTDLYVYFNRFVSGEGSDEDGPGGGLDDDDFVPETGEPKVSTTVQTKIQKLGVAYCESGATRGGGAFGYYYPEPNDGLFIHREAVNIEDTRQYSIVDSASDFNDDDKTGFAAFLSGYRWNHHLYCD